LDLDIDAAKLSHNLPGLLGQGHMTLNGVNPGCQATQNGGLIPGAGTNFQYGLAAIQLEQVGHQRHNVRL